MTCSSSGLDSYFESHRSSSCTHQDVLELDVPVQESLAVQEADPLHHVQGDLQPLPEHQTRLQGAQAASRGAQRSTVTLRVKAMMCVRR